MDFIEQLETLANKIRKQIDVIKTEEATKMAFVMPFIAALGYDVFNPTEVIPEFIADVGEKKGEKVDYAILKDDKVIMLIECKNCGCELSDAHSSQLVRYFTVTETRIAILTNGILYQFYTDLEAPNKMDQKPFMEFDLLDIQAPLVTELKRFTKPDFDLDEMITAASDLKYTKEIKKILAEQLETPSEAFVRFFLSSVYTGLKTQTIVEQFIDITKRAFNQFLNEHINKRLTSAITGQGLPIENMGDEPGIIPTGDDSDNKQRIVTTENELEGYFIVKSILREMIDPDRVKYRDTLSYFGLLLDDNRNKTICRLYFNRQQKYIALIKEDKKEERIPIANLNEIYNLSDRIKATVNHYESPANAEVQ